MIHYGFHKAWQAGGYGQNLIAYLRDLICPEGDEEAPALAPPRPPVRVLVTGHSLGGALATVCAYNIATQIPGAAGCQGRGPVGRAAEGMGWVGGVWGWLGGREVRQRRWRRSGGPAAELRTALASLPTAPSLHARRGPPPRPQPARWSSTATRLARRAPATTPGRGCTPRRYPTPGAGASPAAWAPAGRSTPCARPPAPAPPATRGMRCAAAPAHRCPARRLLHRRPHACAHAMPAGT